MNAEEEEEEESVRLGLLDCSLDAYSCRAIGSSLYTSFRLPEIKLESQNATACARSCRCCQCLPVTPPPMPLLPPPPPPLHRERSSWLFVVCAAHLCSIGPFVRLSSPDLRVLLVCAPFFCEERESHSREEGSPRRQSERCRRGVVVVVAAAVVVPLVVLLPLVVRFEESNRR